MSKKITFTFSNVTENGVVKTVHHPVDLAAELILDLSFGNESFSEILRSATGYETRGLYNGVNEHSFRLEYIVSDECAGDWVACAELIRSNFAQECVLIEIQARTDYSAFLVYADKTEEI